MPDLVLLDSNLKKAVQDAWRNDWRVVHFVCLAPQKCARKSRLKCRKRATFPRKHKSRTHGKSEEIKSAGRQAGRQGRAGQAGAGRGRGRAGRHRGRQAGITPLRTFSWQSPLFAPFRGKSRNSPLGRQLAPQVAPRTTSRHPDDKPPLG